MITSKDLENIGFKSYDDNGYTSTYRFNNYVCEGNDIEGFICDKTNVLIENMNHLVKLYFEVTGFKILTQLIQNSMATKEEMEERYNKWVELPSKEFYHGWAWIRIEKDGLEDITCQYVNGIVKYHYATHFMPTEKPILTT